MKKKNKSEYLRKKKLKQNAKRRESEHVVDYSVDNPVRDEPVKGRSGMDTGMLEMMLMMSMMRNRSSKAREMAVMKKELEDE